MKTPLIARISETEQKKNTQLIYDFYTAFGSGIFSKLEKYLHNEGIFFKNWNKHRFLSHIHKLLFGERKLINADYYYLNIGYSLDYHLAEPVMEMRFVPNYPIDEDDFERAEFGEPANKKVNETVLRYVLTFKDNQIYKIRIAKKVTSDLKYFTENN
jgi:hypothetical protein